MTDRRSNYDADTEDMLHNFPSQRRHGNQCRTSVVFPDRDSDSANSTTLHNVPFDSQNAPDIFDSYTLATDRDSRTNPADFNYNVATQVSSCENGCRSEFDN